MYYVLRYTDNCSLQRHDHITAPRNEILAIERKVPLTVVHQTIPDELLCTSQSDLKAAICKEINQLKKNG